MSVASRTAAEALAEPAPTSPVRHWQRMWLAIESRLAALVDRMNPILVKETRQSLKSRQFVVTFLLVLLACWVVSVGGVAMIGPQIYYGATGPWMLMAYFTVLAVPLALVVPYSAFRSLAAEQEENTFELLSITTLSSKQIVTGKLASAVVQMLVYMSAVSPCIAFTFLLRGVDALTVAMLLAIAIFGSLGLCMAALFVGAVARVRQTQAVISVAVVLGLAGALSGGITLAQFIIYGGGLAFRQPAFWNAMFGALAMYVATFGLLHSAAASQIAFASENRSTPLRRWMLLQQAVFCGCVGGTMYAYGRRYGGVPEALIACGAVAAAYWFILGALLTGEWPHLSRRVQRSLPQSRFGRLFLSLLNPGPGAGYMFAVANLTMLDLAGLVLLAFGDFPARSRIAPDAAVYFLILSWSYVTAYLGLGRLVINALRRWVFVSMTAGFLTQVIILLAGVGAPTVIQLSSRQLRNSGYSLVQLTNPVWTLAELMDHGPAAVQAETLVLIVPAAAVVALLLNMRSIAAELAHQRIALPIRVAEEESQLHPAPTPAPTNPWEAEGDS